MKIIVIGTSLSGKTTIVRYLRSATKLNISEIDEELTNLNGGQYPTDIYNKNDVLVPKIIEKILSLDNIIFFTNTDYFTVEVLKKAKNKGFKIFQLKLDFYELNKRNVIRIKDEGYEDLSRWFNDMLEYQQTVKDAGLVDKVIDANKSIKEIVKELLF